MIIKVCGMREAANIKAVEQLGPDWMGFIFAPKSARYVAQRPGYLPQRARRVGVFVDDSVENVKAKARDYQLDVLQLHGHETPDNVRQLKDWTVVKVFNIATEADLARTAAYEGLADYFLFDTKAQLAGGNGTKFDWSVLAHYHGATPFLLSGGIGPDDVSRLKAFHHPQWAGIDLNSCFESAPAVKDIHKLRLFLEQL